MVDNKHTYIVNGVLEDFKNTIFKPADIVMHVDNMDNFNPYVLNDNLDYTGASFVFIKSLNGKSLKAKEEEVAQWLKTFFSAYKYDVRSKVLFIPMQDLYFGQELESQYWNKGSKFTMNALIFMVIVVMLFALINYINLTVAQSGFRAKEVATNRLYGASKQSVFCKMIIESTLICFVAYVVGGLLAFALEPSANNLLATNLLLKENLTLHSATICTLVVLLMGAIAGVIPGLTLSSFNPIDVVKGTFVFKSKLVFSKLFITIQSAITIIFIGCTITIYKQVDYMINYDYGYNHKAIISIPYDDKYNPTSAYVEKLKALSCTKSVGLTKGTPLNNWGGGSTYFGTDKLINYKLMIFDSSSVKMLGIKLLKDNNVASRGFWLNESAFDILGITEDTETFEYGIGNPRILGIVKDFVIGDLVKSGKKGILLVDINDNYPYVNNILVEIQGNLASGYRAVKKAVEGISPETEFKGMYI